MWGQTPEDDIRLGTTFETFLKGFVSGRMSFYLGTLDSQVRNNDSVREEIYDLTQRVEDLERFREAAANYDSYGNYAKD
jgi:DNA-directed RNA polymerase specialized sigma subunit